MRKRWLIGAILGGTVAYCAPAWAFQEEPTAPAEETVEAPPPQIVQPGIALDLQKGQDAPKKPDGITIPGLGIFLPKMDFGLDLMYGAQQPETRLPDQPTEDMTVLGTVKRRF